MVFVRVSSARIRCMQKSVSFPKGFLWGGATASYQVEGGIFNNNWAEASRQGKVPKCGQAADHYNRFEEDFDIARDLGHKVHRLSVEWSRIEPEEGEFSQEAVDHYKKVLESLRQRGIEPMVTCWHFTMPDWFAERDGFEQEGAYDIFARYCRFLVEQFGGQVKYWVTINEPYVYATKSYIQSDWPPFRRHLLRYFASLDNMQVAHKTAYLAMKEANNEIWVGVAKHNKNISAGWNPFYKIGALIAEWFYNKRFLDDICGYQDFIGLNYYIHTQLGKGGKFEKTDMGWNIYPKGFYRQLKKLKCYDLPVFVTENGIADSDDDQRWPFIRDHILWMHKAMEEGVDVRGYMYWSLLDNYEWSFGFEKRFGLVAIDYDTQERHIRASALKYAEVCKNNRLDL